MIVNKSNQCLNPSKHLIHMYIVYIHNLEGIFIIRRQRISSKLHRSYIPYCFDMQNTCKDHVTTEGGIEGSIMDPGYKSYP